MTVVLYVKIAGWQSTVQDELLLPHGGAYSGTGEWNSRFCSVRVKINEYSIVEYRYKQHSFAETALCRQSVRVC